MILNKKPKDGHHDRNQKKEGTRKGNVCHFAINMPICSLLSCRLVLAAN